MQTTSKVRRLFCIVAVFLTGAFQVYADSYTFTDVELNPTLTSYSANGINDAGTIVGSYSQGGRTYGFQGTVGSFTTISGPSGASNIEALAISNSGAILGSYGYNSGGFIISGSGVTSFQYPSTAGSPAYMNPTGINADGTVTANIVFYKGPRHPYLYNNGVFTPLTFQGGFDTTVNGINDAGAVVGTYSKPGSGGEQAYEYINGNLINLNVPFDIAVPTGINDAGDIVGSASNGGLSSGFIYHNGVFTLINDPSGINTVVNGINDEGQLVGSYQRNGQMVGFLASPIATPEPASFWLLTISFCGLRFAIKSTGQRASRKAKDQQ